MGGYFNREDGFISVKPYWIVHLKLVHFIVNTFISPQIDKTKQTVKQHLLCDLRIPLPGFIQDNYKHLSIKHLKNVH